MLSKYNKSILSIIIFLLVSYSANSQMAKLSGQDFTISFTSPSHTVNNGSIINSCAYDTIVIIVEGDYFQNNTTYNQSNSTNTILYSTTMASIINQNIIKIIPSGIINEIIYISVYDIQGHVSNNSLNLNVIVETPPPSFTGTSTLFDTICQNSYAAIIGNATLDYTINVNNNIIINSGDTTYLPDGSGISYSDTLNISANIADTIININNFSIFATLEHSYLGDLNIKLISPNGTEIVLKSYPGGGSTYLGEPIDNNAQPVHGLGYEYHWNYTASTAMATATPSIYNYTDINGTSYTGTSYLPPSYSYPVNCSNTSNNSLVVYKPESPYNEISGSPINGQWIMVITDNLGIDNGFIFDWGIIINGAISQTYEGVTSKGWKNSTGVVVNTGDIISVYPETPGNHSFTYSATDTFGCVIDTVVSIFARPIPEVELGNDTTICSNQSITLDAGNNMAQFWSDGSFAQTLIIDSINTGFGDTTINVKVVDEYNCNNYDTITITFADCTSLNSNNDEIVNVNLYPNPSKGNFTIEAELLTQEDVIIHIFNIYGKEVLKNKLQNNSGIIKHTIDISNLSKGTYILSLQNNNNSFYNKKVIIN